MKNKIFYGWRMVFFGSLVNAVGVGILYHSFTVFFLPLTRDLNISRAGISLLYGAAQLEGGVIGPLVGYLISRYGPRVMMSFGALLVGVGLILLSTVHSFLPFLLLYTFTVSIGYSAGFYYPVSVLMINWFIRSRGTAIAIVTAAGNVGGMIMAPLLSGIILNFGWRSAIITASCIIMLVALPAAAFVRRSPEERGLYPDGRLPLENNHIDSVSPQFTSTEVNMKVRDALHTARYWLLAFGITLRILVTVALSAHFVPVLVWKGVSETVAAYFVSLFAFCTILTQLSMGYFGDRWNKPLLCSIGIIPTITGILVLVVSQSTFSLYLLTIGLAFTMGTTPLNWSLIGDFFGRHSYATLRGIMAVGYGIATFLSPIYAGWTFDHTGSYMIALVTFSIILTAAATIFIVLRRRTPPAVTVGSLQ